eukprot:scaffold23_cov175-Amphora_coffeaeformis.AAC.2
MQQDRQRRFRMPSSRSVTETVERESAVCAIVNKNDMVRGNGKEKFARLLLRTMGRFTTERTELLFPSRFGARVPVSAFLPEKAHPLKTAAVN